MKAKITALVFFFFVTGISTVTAQKAEKLIYGYSNVEGMRRYTMNDLDDPTTDYARQIRNIGVGGQIGKFVYMNLRNCSKACKNGFAAKFMSMEPGGEERILHSGDDGRLAYRIFERTRRNGEKRYVLFYQCDGGQAGAFIFSGKIQGITFPEQLFGCFLPEEVLTVPVARVR